MDTLNWELASFLVAVQNALNEALRNEKQNVPEHSAHPPFHFDFIESTVPNALAFRDDDCTYSFIGITMGLIYMMWDTCVSLSKSNAVGALLEMAETSEREEAILTIMFQTQLSFMVAHEYTHHVHGHFSQRTPGSEFLDDIVGKGVGNLHDQAFELDADGYAVYHVLAHLIDGPRREQATQILNCKDMSAIVQDQILLSSFVMAVGAFLYALPPASANPPQVYDHTHPIQVVRMRWIMNNAIGWCKQNERSALAAFMDVDRYRTLMVVVDRATKAPTGGHDWREQSAFLKSEDGSKYVRQLSALVRGTVQAVRIAD